MWTRRLRPCGATDAASSKRPGLGCCSKDLRRCSSLRRQSGRMNLDQDLPPGGESIVDKVAPGRRSVTRVLVVDDEPSACKLLSIILGPPDYNCSTASNGKEALIVLQREPFDAIISDLQMPGMSGTELLAEARRRQPHLPFLVTTRVDHLHP